MDVVPFPRHPYLRQLRYAQLAALETITVTVEAMNSYVHTIHMHDDNVSSANLATLKMAAFN